MPIGEIAGEVLGGTLRVVGRILFEVFFELIIKGTGYALVRLVRPKEEPGETTCAVVGLFFWCAVGIGSYFVYRASAA
jgi:hypothetical protein